MSERVVKGMSVVALARVMKGRSLPMNASETDRRQQVSGEEPSLSAMETYHQS